MMGRSDLPQMISVKNFLSNLAHSLGFHQDFLLFTRYLTILLILIASTTIQLAEHSFPQLDCIDRSQ